jgi:hypothetical protein
VILTGLLKQGKCMGWISANIQSSDGIILLTAQQTLSEVDERRESGLGRITQHGS